MNTQITISGQIAAVVEKTYQDEITRYVQFLNENETKGLEILRVKISSNTDVNKLKKGIVVSIPVSIATVNNMLYYSQSGEINFTPRTAS